MKMKKFASMILALLLATSMLACLSSCGGDTSDTGAAATSKLDEVLDRGYLIVGTGSTNAPWHFYNDDGELVGFDIEMAKIVAQSLFGDPEKVEFVEQSSDERVPNVVNGNVDITFQFMTINASRAQQLEFTIPYYVEGAEVLLHKNSKYTTGDELMAALEAGEPVTVAVLQNSFAEQLVDIVLGKEYENVTVDQYEDQALLYQALESGRCDAATPDMSNAQYLAATDPNFIATGISGYPQLYGGGVAKGDQVWLNYVNTVLLDAMCGANYNLYNDAYAEWFGVELDPPQTGKPSMYR